MKSWSIASLALLLLLSLVAVAQDVSPSTPQTTTQTHKPISFTAKMSADGQLLLRAADNQAWTVSNPEALQGFAGREVVIRGQIMSESNQLRVVSVKPAKSERQYLTKWDDSAFRR